jgi:hypothetical protein
MGSVLCDLSAHYRHFEEFGNSGKVIEPVRRRIMNVSGMDTLRLLMAGRLG